MRAGVSKGERARGKRQAGRVEGAQAHEHTPDGLVQEATAPAGQALRQIKDLTHLVCCIAHHSQSSHCTQFTIHNVSLAHIKAYRPSPNFRLSSKMCACVTAWVRT